MNRLLVMLSYSLLIASSASAENLGADFKEACGVFEEALALDSEPEVMAKYVQDNLQYRVQSEEVIEIYDAIFLADPAERYKLFKEAAEMNMEGTWDCLAFKVFVE